MAVKSDSQFVVLLGGPFNQMDCTEFKGGDLKRDVERYPKGLSDEMGHVVGITQYEDVTLRTPYDPDIHDPVIQKFLDYCGEAIDITVQPMKICPERTPDGKARIYTGCTPIKVMPPEVDRSSNKTAYLEMSFAVSGMKLS